MISNRLLLEKINLISGDLLRFEELSDKTIADLSKYYFKYAVLKNIFMEIIGRAIDINRHIISESDQITEIPKTYREIFIYLSDLKVYPGEFADKIACAVGFRKAIVHEYNNLDKNKIFNTNRRCCEDFQKILRIYYKLYIGYN